MARKRTGMKKIREILRLHENGHLSNRQISSALKISRQTVNNYIKLYEKNGLSFQELESKNDTELLILFGFTEKKKHVRANNLEKQFLYYTKELKKTGVTLKVLWEEYISKYPDGYSYSQFCFNFAKLCDSKNVSMHITHKAGDKSFVDFTGKKFSIRDRSSGVDTQVETFISVLGASQLTYVEVVANQKMGNWIKANENAFLYFGGVSAAIVPDNLKSGVTKASKYEPEINPTYMNFSRHYDTIILPARPYKPKDKSLVENMVSIIYTRVYAALRNQIFYSIEELNKAIKPLLEKHNNTSMQKLGISRRELFEEIEKDALKPLPADRYEIKDYERLTVLFNYHIFLKAEKRYYSVPYRYKGIKADVFYTANTVEIYHNNERIAVHCRSSKRGYSTTPSHMPANHRFMYNWNPQRFLKWADKVGPNVNKIIAKILDRAKHPEQSYKVCLGILNLPKQYNETRVDKACAKAMEFGFYSLKRISNILKNNLEDVQEEFSFSEKPLPEHENIRGQNYYETTGVKNEQ